MLSGAHLVRNLGAQLNHIGSASEQGKRLLGSPYGTGKGARLHNPLDPLTAKLDDDTEQAVPELELRRLINKESGIQAHTTALSTRGDSATRNFAERSLSRSLTQVSFA
jgi:hypothetical protein